VEALEVRSLLSTMDPLGPWAGHGTHDHDASGGRRRGSGRSETHVISGEAHQFVADAAPDDEPLGPATAAQVVSGLATFSLASIPALSSLLGAAATLYLDFDGHFEPVWGGWTNVTNPAYDVDGDESTFTQHELDNIVAIWKAVAEDYAPFNINVTTVEPAVLAPGVSIAGANKVAQRVAIGGTPDILGLGTGTAGYAYINAFTSSVANVAYVMPASFTSRDTPTSMADFISHEAGHAFGLRHQSVYDASGTLTLEYNPGDRATWAPIMGTFYYQSQANIWHNGPNNGGATSLQDDIAVIAGTTNGFGLRADDHGNTAAAATVMTPSGGTWTATGRIGTNTDVDVFRLTAPALDTYRIALTGAEVEANLDAVIELRTIGGQLLATADPAGTRDARLVRELPAGDYTITVKKVATYGWLGQYTLAIDAPPAGVTVTPGARLMSTAEDGRAATFTVALDTRPAADVLIPLALSDPDEGTPSAPSLVFTPANWDVPQTVTITGAADGLIDGDTAYAALLGPATSVDPAYAGLDPADVALVSIDIDEPGYLYRNDSGGDTILRQRLGGQGAETVVDLVAAFGDLPGTITYSPQTIAVDPAGGKVYWFDGGARSLNRSNLDGTAPQVLFSNATGYSYGLDLDTAAGQVYWLDYVDNTIRRANLDGSGVVDLVVGGLEGGRGFALDPAGDKMYWADYNLHAIRRANLDGSAVESIWTGTPLDNPFSLAIDRTAGKLYWSDSGSDVIRRANLDGSGAEIIVEIVLDLPAGSLQSSVLGMSVDAVAGKLYWTDQASRTIYRANLDGSLVVPLATGQGVRGVQVVRLPAPAITVLPGTGISTTEAGGVGAFSVSLTARPTAPFTIPIGAPDATEGTVSATSLTFTPDNWNVPQFVTITGVNDASIDGNISYSIVLGPAASADPAYHGMNPADVVVTNADDDQPVTKFYVVNDGSPDRNYEYTATGSAVENYALNTGNTAPRGAASTAAGDKVWVVDANKKVFIYSAAGALLGSWTAGSLPSNATVEGLATNGTDVWIVDARGDRIYRYTGAATRLSGTQNAASNFALNSGNRDPKDVVTDGANLWVVNASTTDKVFKYTLTGSLVGSWTITGAGSNPTGLTLDPAGGGHLWIVDSGTDRVYQFDNARSRASGSQSPATSFALAAGNTNPQGIADPPVADTTRDIPPRRVDSADGSAPDRRRTPRILHLIAPHEERGQVLPFGPRGLRSRLTAPRRRI
jgi:hypothetical protein